MPSLLSRLFDRGADRKAGLVFASHAGDERWAAAVPGTVIRNASAGPPWIVVSHDVESVVAAKWPGRLWEVEVVEEASDQPREGAGYTRAVAVKVVRELPVSILFGERGEDVLRVIDRATSIVPGEVEVLAARTSGEARAAYSRAWNAWISRRDAGSYHLGADHGDTLAAPAGRMGSPIGGGFSVLYTVFSDRARALAGDAAFEVDEEEGDVYLADPWSSAARALLDAAMALGAPKLIPDEDRRILLDAWEHGFGRG